MVGKTNRNGKDEEEGAESEDPQQEYQDKLNRKGKQQKLRPGIEKDLSKLQGKLKNQEDISDARIGKFARALASTDWHTRERALSMFETFLRSSENVPSDGLRKMWKGLYYSFWHSDKVPVQQELAKRLLEPSLVPRGQPPRRAGLLARFLGHDGPGVELCGPAQARQVHELGPHVRPRLP